MDLGKLIEGVPILGPAMAPLMPTLEPVFNALGLGDGGGVDPSSLLSLTPSQVGQVQQAVAQAINGVVPGNVTGLTSALPAPPAPLPTGTVQAVTSNLPVQKLDEYSGGNTNCSASQTYSTWAPDSTYADFTGPSDVTLDNPAGIAAPVTPPAKPESPALPANPPNTPVAPAAAPNKPAAPAAAPDKPAAPAAAPNQPAAPAAAPDKPAAPAAAPNKPAAPVSPPNKPVARSLNPDSEENFNGDVNNTTPPLFSTTS